MSQAWRWLRAHALSLYAGLAIAYLLIPIVVVVLFSFNNPPGKYNFTWHGFTLEHWANAFGIPGLNSAMLTSVQLAALASAISTTLGTLLALALVRYDFLGRRAANILIVIPLATPEVVMGAALLSLFLIYGLTPGFVTLLLAHVMFCISYTVIVVRSRLVGFDRSLEEAAQDLGANRVTTFRRVTLPLIMPAVVSAALLTFVVSLDDFVVSNFNSGTTTTFPLFVFGSAIRGIPVEINVIATMLLTLTVLVMVATVIQQQRSSSNSA